MEKSPFTVPDKVGTNSQSREGFTAWFVCVGSEPTALFERDTCATTNLLLRTESEAQEKRDYSFLILF